MRTVATNLTDLHREPSFLSELLTQVLNGRALEVLEERDRWCYVRQPEDGYLGWVYKPYLTDESLVRATHVVTAASPAVYAEKSNPPEALTRLLAGSRVELLRQEH